MKKHLMHANKNCLVIMLHVIYVTWAGVISLIHMYAQAPWHAVPEGSVDISENLRPHMLHVMEDFQALQKSTRLYFTIYIYKDITCDHILI